MLSAGMAERKINTPALAKSARVSYETARRAVLGITGISLDSTTKLLVAVGLRLVAVPLSAVAPEPTQETTHDQ